jgi:urease subunit alpha
VGTLTAGRLADVVLWKPAYFGVKPEAIFKSGYPAWAPLGEGNASVERAEPTRYRPDFGGLAAIAPSLGVTFVSGAAPRDRLATRLGTARRLVPVRGCRGLTHQSLARNRATAPIDIDPFDGKVTLAGRPLEVEPATEVPLSRRYLLR